MDEKAERDDSGRFRPGHGGGPGRPRGRGIGAALRRAIDADAYAALLLDIAFDRGAERGKWKPAERLRALELVADRAEGKPIATNLVAAQIATSAAPPELPAGWDAMPRAERARWLDTLMAGRMLGEGNDE